MLEILTSRSMAELYQKCPRARYYTQFYVDVTSTHTDSVVFGEQDNFTNGIVPVYSSIPLVTGSSVHRGVEHLLKRAKLNANVLSEDDCDGAVTVAQMLYAEEIGDAGFERSTIASDNQHEEVYREQLALTEALVRAWWFVELPMILDRFSIVSVEKDIAVPLTAGITWMAKVDALLRDKKDKSLYAYSLKTAKEFTKRTEASYKDDLQGVTETWAIEEFGRQKGKEIRMMGVRFCFLVKGKRHPENYDWDDENAKYITSSPLIRGWKNITPMDIQYAHSQWFPNKDNKSGKGRLGKGWEGFKVWEDYLGGVKGWIEALARNVYQPEIGDILGKQVVTPNEYFKDQVDINSTMNELISQESRVQQGVSVMYEAVAEGSMDEYASVLDDFFPRYRHSCNYPTECCYKPICWDGCDPLHDTKNGDILYQIRTPHHEIEQERLGKEKE